MDGGQLGGDIVHAIAEQIISYAVTHGMKLIATLLRKHDQNDPAQTEFEVAFKQALNSFQLDAPDWTAALFDKYFLEHGAAQLFARYLDSSESVTPNELAEAWAKGVGPTVSPEMLEQAEEMASRFLRVLERKLQRYPTFQYLTFLPALDSVQQIAANMQELVTLHKHLASDASDILRELRLRHQVHPLDIHSEMHGAPFDERILLTCWNLIDRNNDRVWLLDRLRAAKLGRIYAICGLAGVGKTALIAEVLGTLHEDGTFPDGIAVVECKGITEASLLLRRVLRRFDPYRREPDLSQLEELQDFARVLLRGKSAIIVLDNVEPNLLVERVTMPLTSSGCRVLISSRHMLSRAVIKPSDVRILDLLEEGDATDLFTSEYSKPLEQEIGNEGTESNRLSEVIRIVRLLGRHTLAVKLAAHYAGDVGRDLSTLATELEDPQLAIALPDGEIPNAVALAFAQSTDALPEEARTLFQALAAFAEPNIGRKAALAIAASLGVVHPPQAVELLIRRALVEQRVDTVLGEDCDRERISLHPLLWAFAASGFETWERTRQEAVHAAISRYYAVYATTITNDAAIVADNDNIDAGLNWANKSNDVALIAQYSYGLHEYWSMRGRTSHILQHLPLAIGVFEQIFRDTHRPEALAAIAALLTTHSLSLEQVGRADLAETSLQTALEIRLRLGDAEGQIGALSQLAMFAQNRGENGKADAYFERALQQAKEMGSVRDICIISLSLAQAAHVRGDMASADDLLTKTEAMIENDPECRELITNWHIISGQLARSRSQTDLAMREFLHAVDEGQHSHQTWLIVAALSELGDILQVQGRLGEAEQYLEQAMQVAKEAQNKDAEASIRLSLAKIAPERGRWKDARAQAQASLALGQAVKKTLAGGRRAL